MLRYFIFSLFFLLLPSYGGAVPALTGASRIEFTSKQMGVPINGSFKKFDADIQFDPKTASNSHASITIYLDSIDAGSDEATVEIKRKSWFDTNKYPKAEFASTSLAQAGQDKYTLKGKMTIKGRTHDISAPFIVKREKENLVFEGMFTLNRLDYGIGEGAWSDTDTVANEVVVSFRFAIPANTKSR